MGDRCARAGQDGRTRRARSLPALLLLGAAAMLLVVGVLGMHVLGGGSAAAASVVGHSSAAALPHTAVAASESARHTGPVADHALAAPAAERGADCGACTESTQLPQGHQHAIATLCVLALLEALFLLPPGALLGGWTMRRHLPALATASGARRAPPQLSPLLLSISRT